MKAFLRTILLIIYFILTFIPLNLHSQWIIQTSGTNQNLYDVEFLNENTGWALGDGGVVIKTTNGGLNWINVPNPAVNKPLSSIHIVNENVIYFVGWFETIVKTTNGGTTWIVIRNGTGGNGASYDGVFFIDENTGWICGTGEKVLKTTNGGQTLDSTYLFWGSLWDIYFKDANTGLISASGNIFKTTNGGINWFAANIPLGGSFPVFHKISVVNDQYCWVAGNSRKIFKSSDFGSNWELIDTIQEQTFLRCIDFANQFTGWIGGINTAYLYKSTDGGLNWAREETHGDMRFWASLRFIDTLIGWGCGGAGKMFHTTTGGQTAVSILSNSGANPEKYILHQNYPNPFNPQTTIKYELNTRGNVELTVFDISGKQIEKLVDERQSNGSYVYIFKKVGLSSGIYYYQLTIDGMTIGTKKMVLVK